MFRILFLILFLFGSFVFAQTEDKTPPKAYKFLEFGRATNGYIKKQTDAFMEEMQKDQASRGYIINYGSPEEIKKREQQLRRTLASYKYDTQRITMVNGGNLLGKLNTVFWIVPADAEYPKP